MSEPRPIARALRLTALVSLVVALDGAALDLLEGDILAAMKAEGDFAVLMPRFALLSWLRGALGLAATTATIVLAGRWARASGRLASLVQIARVLMGLGLVAGLAWQVWTVLEDDPETIGRAALWMNWSTLVGWLAGVLLLAGTRGPIALRVAYPVVSLAWSSFLVAARIGAVEIETPELVGIAGGMPVALLWSTTFWLSARAYAAHEPVRLHSDDPARRLAARGLATIRGAIVMRIVLGILAAMLVISFRTAPEAAGTVVWVLAIGQCCVAGLIAYALNQYGGLADEALGRGSLALALLCLGVGAVLELIGAFTVSALFDALAKPAAGTMGELARLQTSASWIGRMGSAAGIVGALALALSLKRTAAWLGDQTSAARAGSIVALTIAGGGSIVVLLAVMQAGAVHSMGAMIAIALASLAFAIGLLLAWLSLLARLAERLDSA
jgi:hypothetical protein